MSQFYARYVPPKKPTLKTPEPLDETLKRKHEEHPAKAPKHAKVKRQKLNEQAESINGNLAVRTPKNSQGDVGQAILNKYSISEFAQQKVEEGGRHVVRNKRQRKDEVPEEAMTEEQSTAKGAVSLSGVDVTGETNQDEAGYIPDPVASKHSGTMSRFEKSKVRSAQYRDLQNVTDKDRTEADDSTRHDLEPIPQPQVSDTITGKPSFSVLAPWQSDAVRVDQKKSQTFASMKLSKEIVTNLEKNKIEKAFPIQSTVIPLLLGDEATAMNDLCVSAATGSGKTLAYVIPIIEHLRRPKLHKLRAVIVVPTRELVQQVRDICEICAAGSSLRIVTAVGSKSMKEEQDLLIQEEDIYDPDAYQQQQNAPIDWSTFDLVAELESAQRNQVATPVLYVTQRRIKADILITTPGRLVDHLKNTAGFHLDDLEWLVVDEADRLLNESYQEWIDAVLPALRSRQATQTRDDILRCMRLDLPPRIVHKILLSATMTQDISKLNALDLRKPKLVILESSDPTKDRQQPNLDGGLEDGQEIVNSGDYYHIPPSLSETVLAFNDGSEKPMILLQLLQRLMHNIHADGTSKVTEADESSDSSSSDDSDIASSDDSDLVSTVSSSSTSISSDSESSTSTKSVETQSNNGSLNQSTGDKLPIDPNKNTSRALVFTKSTAAASRLSRLLSLMSVELASNVATLTRSTASSASSRKALSAIRSGKISILIATDRASRGIDVPGLEHVVNYDIPASALTYVHRVGRTARAGLAGHAWSLVEHREGRWFWNEIGGKSEACTIKRSTAVEKTIAKVDDDPALQLRYESALRQLGEEVRGQ